MVSAEVLLFRKPQGSVAEVIENLQRDTERLGYVLKKQGRKEDGDLEPTLSNVTWLSRMRPKEDAFFGNVCC